MAIYLTDKEDHTSLELIKVFPDGPVVKNLPINAGEPGLIPGQGTSTCQASLANGHNY